VITLFSFHGDQGSGVALIVAEEVPERIIPTGSAGSVSKVPKRKRGIKTKWCERGGSNPHGFLHWILSPARLPVPPLSPWEKERGRPGLAPKILFIFLFFPRFVKSGANSFQFFSPGIPTRAFYPFTRTFDRDL
jgi:hypothetical protein